MARFLLVHGAFHGAWCWASVVEGLRAAGHEAEAIDLPGSGDDDTPQESVTLEAYARRITDALEAGSEPAILVGHSMGGIAVTQAAAYAPDRVAQAVHVAAFLPQDGESLLSLAQLPEAAGDGVQANMVVEGEPPVATMPREAAREVFYGEVAAEHVEAALDRIGPQAVVPFLTPVQLAPHSVRRRYVVSTRDRAIPVALQRRMASERGCDVVVEIDTDHSPFLSRPTELVAVLDAFAGA